MALLEAHILGCPVVSFQPGLLEAERCTAVRLGLVPRLLGTDDLRRWLDETLSAGSAVADRGARSARCYGFARPEAAKNVIRLAEAARVL